ncbi:MAG: MBL fold metallo-hydrolase [Gemmatimonadaceae bacterium]|nr:MBL fold metallo-hydrolase [Gemmatimonadaceae bacterium]
MFFRHLYEPSLAQASYFIGCQATGEAVVVDPLRDVDRYIALAEAEGFRISAITETHIHADFCSGARELAARTSAQLFLSGEGGDEWRYRFVASDRAVELMDGDVIGIGNIRLTAMHTPGHTPEHLVFLVTDGANSNRPMGMLTGDFLFVGDVGRPDLLERAAKQVGTMEAGARALYRSLQRVAALPDYLQLWPGHGAGSACGRALGAVPQSSLGYERLVNWALQPQSEDEFVAEVLRDQPDAPAYFGVMKQINRDGPPVLGAVPALPLRSAFEAQEWLDRLGLMIDTRPAHDYARGHVRRTLNIPATKSFSNWFGSLLDYGSAAWLLVQDQAQGERLLRELMMIGYDNVAGVTVVSEDTMPSTATAQVPQRSAASLAGALGRSDVLVLDVRSDSEFRGGHIPGAVNIPLGELPERLRELPADGTIVTQCASGGRSAIAASLLLMAGAAQVENLAGGIEAWRNGGFEVESGPAPSASITDRGAQVLR